MIRYYQIGDIRIRYDGPWFEARDYLRVFEKPFLDDETDLEISIENQNPELEYNTRLFMREAKLPSKVLDYDAIFLHASYIIWHGKAILFTASKQTGKSTQAGLWEKYKGAEVINGDRALLRRRMIDNMERWAAYGSPYCGTSDICKNKCADLAAIVILGQAACNEIRPARVNESVQAMLDGCSYDISDIAQVQKVMELTTSIVQTVPFIRLNCLPDETAVNVLEEYLCRTIKM